MGSYDEDLNENSFFLNLKESHSELFNQCVEERWLICVPRRESLPTYAFTIEDYFNHILRPNTGGGDETEERSRKTSGSSRADSDSCCGSVSSGDDQVASDRCGSSKWNYQTLSQVSAEYRPNQFIKLDETDILRPHGNINEKHLTVEVLFEETFYSENKRKYKVLCIESPLYSKNMPKEAGDNVEEVLEVHSLRDCIDFLWMKGKLRVLESYDAYIKLFLHNHRTLENLPVPIQRDVVYTLYLKCLNFALTNEAPIEGSNTYRLLKLATETYVLNGVYRFLMGALTSAVSSEDGQLNKIIRNLGGIHPQELDIDPLLWNNLGRARQELGKLDVHSAPLAKLTCLKRTLRHIHADPSLEGREAGVLAADDLLLIWVYLVVKTPLANWSAQLQYLTNFRFSVEDGKDNENSFLITTLEAALTHLMEGKVLGLAAGERELSSPCCESAESWLRPLPDDPDEACDERVAEMFACVRTGNTVRLAELISFYEEDRKKQAGCKVPNVDPSELCHPLCDCESCTLLVAPTQDSVSMPAAVELTNESGMALLHMACIYGRPKVVEYLLSIGSRLEPTDLEGSTPLHYAASRGNQNALLLLLHAGASMEPVDKLLKTPLHLAAQNGHEGCVKALIYYAEHSRLPLNMSPQDLNRNTPLHEASRWGFQGIVQILVENGASITATNNRNATPVDCAHDIHIIRILQRSERRRSWVQSNHGDFINVEVVTSEDSDGIVMLISEPNNNLSQNEDSCSKDEPEKKILPTASAKQRRHSIVVPPTLCVPEGEVDNTSPKQRRHSSVIPPRAVTPDVVVPEQDLFRSSLDSWSPSGSNSFSNTPPWSRRQSTATPPMLDTPPRSRRQSSIIPPNMGSNTLTIPEGIAVHHSPDTMETMDDEHFIVEGSSEQEVRRVSRDESQQIRKVSVESLDNIAVALLPELPAAMGVKRKRENQSRDMRKLFTTIAVGDVPLALFYLGIPADELDSPENDKEVLERIPNCHPLCPCKRCAARSAGLGLDINTRNLEGMNALHLAAKYGLTTLAKILYRFGADINAKSTYDCKTALQYARDENHSAIVDFLLKQGATE